MKTIIKNTLQQTTTMISLIHMIFPCVVAFSVIESVRGYHVSMSHFDIIPSIPQTIEMKRKPLHKPSFFERERKNSYVHINLCSSTISFRASTHQYMMNNDVTKYDTEFDEKEDILLEDLDEKNEQLLTIDQQRRCLLRNSLHLSTMITSLLTSSTTTTMTTTNMAWASSVAEEQCLIPNPIYSKDFTWPIGKVAFSLLPLAGTSSRRHTVEEEIIPNCIYTYDQIQGIVNVNVPVRQTVIVMKDGGLWVHNPVAPTPQLLQMMDRLITKFGPIRHIVLGTVALEHKATFGPFASYYPNATVWIQPNQWSFPLSIPIEFLGVQQRGPRLREIPVVQYDSNTNTSSISVTASSKKYQYYATQNPIPEWMEEIDYDTLGPFNFESVGGCYSESVFFHKDTKTLLVSDCVVSVTNDHIPSIIVEDPRALLFHSRDTATEVITEDTIERRQKGWRRMVQFGLVFFPSQIQVSTLSQAFEDAKNVPKNLRNLGKDAIPGNTLYPWSWNPNDIDQMNFDSISQNGTLFVPPILTKLILDREPQKVLQFVDRVTERFHDMERIIPCHLNNNIRIENVRDFYQAFEPLRSTPTNIKPQRPLAEDLALLQKASDLLTRYQIVKPSQICDGEPARQVGRFATK